MELPVIRDPRGALAFVQSPTIPFSVNRVYYLYDLQSGSARGGHSHKSLEQLLIALSGSFRVQLVSGKGAAHEYFLSDPGVGLYVPSGYWRTIDGFSAGAVCLVLASDVYDESDYIRDFDEYIEWCAQHDTA